MTERNNPIRTTAEEISELQMAVARMEAMLNNGLKAMVIEHRAELKAVNIAVQTIRDQVTSHVAKEDVLFEIFRHTLITGMGVTGGLIAILLSVIGYLLTRGGIIP